MSPMVNSALQYPIYGPEIQCPHCRQKIPALTLTDTYLCSRHGAFEADPDSKELVHLQSAATLAGSGMANGLVASIPTPTGIRFENSMNFSLDRLYTEGYRATRVIIGKNRTIIRDLVNAYLERNSPWAGAGRLCHAPSSHGAYRVEFRPVHPTKIPKWAVKLTLI